MSFLLYVFFIIEVIVTGLDVTNDIEKRVNTYVIGLANDVVRLITMIRVGARKMTD